MNYLSMFTQCENVGHLENEYDISIIASAHSNRVNFINKIYKNTLLNINFVSISTSSHLLMMSVSGSTINRLNIKIY